LVNGRLGINMPNHLGVVIGGHDLEGPWIKLRNILAMGLSWRRQGDGKCSKNSIHKLIRVGAWEF
jgi:hypothetical protein